MDDPTIPSRSSAARDACDDAGALLILGEVQTGMGRTGLVINVPGDGMLRFLPPLVIGEDEMNAGIEILRHALG